MTKRLLVASANPGKLVEISRLLAGVAVEVVGLAAYPDAPELPEPYETFAQNAESKARAAAEFAGCAALADDSGLQVEALGGRPGVYSARYAASDPQRVARLLEELRGVAGGERKARFVCAVALARPGHTIEPSRLPDPLQRCRVPLERPPAPAWQARRQYWALLGVLRAAGQSPPRRGLEASQVPGGYGGTEGPAGRGDRLSGA